VFAAVDVALQVHQEQPPHRRSSASHPPPRNPTIRLHPSTVTAVDGPKGRSNRDRRRLGTHSSPFLDKSIGTGGVAAVVVSARQQASGEMGMRAMAWAGGVGDGGLRRTRARHTGGWCARDA
jgi:hypothetical protein